MASNRSLLILAEVAKSFMDTQLSAIILGLVQGLTEFLPVSSSGHQIITSHLLRLTSDTVKTFEVVIQLGSILAVVVVYWQRFLGLLNFKAKERFSGFRGLYLLFLTCLPASLVGLLAHDYITTHLFNPISVALALAVGALFILYAEHKGEDDTYGSVEDLTPKAALGIGCFQCLSLWPGFSRSTSTIMGGMLLGAKRKVAAEYSFLAAVPIMFAATSFVLLKAYKHLSVDDIPFFLTGSAVAFVSSLAAIKILLKLISHTSFRLFAWYRLAIAPLVYFYFY